MAKLVTRTLAVVGDIVDNAIMWIDDATSTVSYRATWLVIRTKLQDYFLQDLVEDTTPQLGGGLDVNGQKIISVANGNIDIEPNGTGDVFLGNYRFDADQVVGAGQDNYVLTYDNTGGKISLEVAAGGVSDGDKGDITVTGAGATWTIDNQAVTLAKMANILTDSFIGRDTAGTGVPEVLSVATTKTLLNLTGTNSGDQTITLTGNVTGSGTGSFAATIANDAVTLAKLQNAVANSKLLGSGAAGAGVDYVEVTLGTNLSMSGTTLNATGGGGSGDLKADGTIPLTADWNVGAFDIQLVDLRATGRVTVGNTTLTVDDLFYLNALDATTPQVLFDTGDWMEYDRTNNRYEWWIGGFEVMNLTDTILRLVTGSIELNIGSMTAGNRVHAGDSVLTAQELFYMGFADAVTPQILFDTGDWMEYDRTNNRFEWLIGSSLKFSLNGATADFTANNITTTGNVIAGGVYVANPFLDIDNQFYLSSLGVDEPVIVFDSGDRLSYDRASNEFIFEVGSSVQFALNATTADFQNNAITTTGAITGSNLSGTNTGNQTITLTGDVTGSGTGSFAATIAADSVTLAKIANAAASSKLVGSGDAGIGVNYVEITLGTNLSMSGTTLNATGGGGVSDGDKGDITVTASGATWTIDPDVVTLAKMQNAVANSKLLGSGAAGAGADYVEVTLGTGLSFTGTTLNVTAGTGDLKADGTVPLTADWSVGAFDIQLVDLRATGRVTAGNTTLTVDDLFYLNALDATTPQVLFDTGDWMEFDRTNNRFEWLIGSVVEMTLNASTADFQNNAITTTGTITGSNLSGTNTGNQTITLTGDVTGSGTGSFAATIANNAVTLVKMADMATASFLGRNTAATGDPEVLSIATSKTMLNLTGTNSGDQTITLTGDVTGSGTGSFAATIAADSVTLAKIANAAASSKLVGSGDAGIGVNYVEITLGTNLSMSGTTLNATGGGGSVGTDVIWDAAGDLVQGTGANTAARLPIGTANQLLRVNAGATAAEWFTQTGGTGDLKADGTVPLTANWNVGAFNITAVDLNATGRVYAGDTVLTTDSLFYMGALDITTPHIVFDTGDSIAYARGVDRWEWKINSTNMMFLDDGFLNLFNNQIIVGGGLIIGDTTLTVDNVFTIGALDATTPQILFDTGDWMEYDRTANRFEWLIGSVVEMTLNATTLDLQNNNISTTGTITASGNVTSLSAVRAGNTVLTVDDLFYMGGLDATTPQILFDTGDWMEYDRTTNSFEFQIGSVLQLKIDASTADFQNNNIETIGNVTTQNIILTPSPTSDLTASGIRCSFTTSEACVFGDLMAMGSDGQLDLADANVVAEKVFCMALATLGIGNSGAFLMQGFARNDAWNWTPGNTLYNSEVAGTMTATVPLSSGVRIQPVATAINADRVYFNPTPHWAVAT